MVRHATSPTRDADLLGFGDVVTPAPETVQYPVLLEDLPPPSLRACPKYTLVAEKFQALCTPGMANMFCLDEPHLLRI